MAKQVTLTTPGANALYSKTVLDSNFSLLNANFENFLHLGGVKQANNSVLGNTDFGGFEALNALTPTVASSLATKGYVDQRLVLGSTTGTIGSLIADVDGDTYVNVEVVSDDDTVHIAAAVSGGSADALTIVGTPGSAASVSNPALTVQRNLILASGVKLGDASVPNTYIELTRSGSDDTIFAVAGGNAIMSLSSDTILASQNIEMAATKKIGDIDGDTYITFNETSDDDTVRIYAGGVEQLTITSSTISIAITGSTGAFGVGGADATITGATKFLAIPEGTTATTPSNLADNEILIYGSNVTGIESQLNFDFKNSASTKATIVLGEDSIFPNDLAIGGNLSTTGSTTNTGGSNLNGGGSLVGSFSGNHTLSGVVNLTGGGSIDAFTTINSDTIRLTSTGDASVSSTDHAFQIGASDVGNLIMDGNEIMVRFNGAASTFLLNNDGGQVSLSNEVYSDSVTAVFAPLTDSVTSLGTTILRWSNLFADAATIGDTLVVEGDLAVTGTTTLGALTSWPVFRAEAGVNSNITGTAKLNWTEEFDSNNNFSSSRFTPTVAGHYLINANFKWANVVSGDTLNLFVYKNGASEKFVSVTINTSVGHNQITAIVEANGSTDYFEIFASNSLRDTSDGAGGGEFSACRVG